MTVERDQGRKLQSKIERISDKYLALGCWFVLLIIYVVLFLLGHESKVIESMLSAAFGALMMGLQIGFKRLEDAIRNSNKSNSKGD